MLKQLSFYLRQSLLSLVSIGGGLLLLIAALLSLGYSNTNSYADGPDQADVIVQFDSKNAIVRTIQFTAPISGFTALQQTGLKIEYLETSFGIAVCSIEEVGCPATDCFCNTKYWSYNYWDNQNQMWQGYPVGASDSVITNNIEDYAKYADVISLGWLTHSAPSKDFSMEVIS